MLDVLNKHLTEKKPECLVSTWVKELSKEENEAFASIKEKTATINLASLYKDLNEESKLPFKLTAFRSHMRGYCICQN